jgi:predicted PurR-regulated permease PerM
MSNIKQYIYWILGFLAIVSIYYFFSDIVSWIILAWVVSLLGSPVMHVLGKIKIGKKKINVSIRALITLLIFITSFGLFLALFVPVIIQQGNNLAKVNYTQVIKGLEEPINHFYEKLDRYGLVEHIQKKEDKIKIQKDNADTSALNNQNIKIVSNNEQTRVQVQKINIDSLINQNGDSSVHTTIQLNVEILDKRDRLADADKEIHDSTAIISPDDTPIERVQKQLFTYFNPTAVLRSSISTIWSLIGNFFVLITSVLFIAFFFLQDEGMFATLVKAPFHEKESAKIDRALYLIKKMLVRYFEGILAQMALLTLFLWLALSLVGAQNALLMAFLGAIVNVIPYIGPFIGMIFALVVSICSGLDMDFYTQMMPLLIKIVAVFLGMQVLDNLLLQPLIFSKSVQAHPIEIFVVIVIGSKLAGIVGMILAIPAYTVLRVIASIFLSEFKLVQELTAKLGIKAQWLHNEETVPRPENSDDRQTDRSDRGDGWSNN